MATALAATGVAGIESAAPAQTPPGAAASPNEELAAVRAQLQKNAQQLAQVKLPMATEPACHFKA